MPKASPDLSISGLGVTGEFLSSGVADRIRSNSAQGVDMANSVPVTTVASLHVQATATDVREGFPYFAHHDSVSALWSMKWRKPCAGGIYPFTDGRVEDFDPIFERLVELSKDDPSILRRPDDYAKPFFTVARDLVNGAEGALIAGETSLARELFLRAAAVYRIARFPINRSPMTEEAWKLGKAAYAKGGALLDPPCVNVEIPFKHADPSARRSRFSDPSHPARASVSAASSGLACHAVHLRARRLPHGSHPSHASARGTWLCDTELRDSRHRGLPGRAQRSRVPRSAHELRIGTGSTPTRHRGRSTRRRSWHVESVRAATTPFESRIPMPSASSLS